MLFFLFRKSQIFWFFQFNKKFIRSYKKVKKTNNLKFENKFFLIRKTEKINALLVFYCKKFAIKFRLFVFFFTFFMTYFKLIFD